MNKIRRKYLNRKELRVNKNNDILSTIELFQYFEKKYNIITTTLDDGIQYETDKTRITQTFTKTILDSNINKIIRRLKKEEEITLIIIDNLKTTKENKKVITEKIRRINKLENVKTRVIKQEKTYETIDAIIKEE